MGAVVTVATRLRQARESANLTFGELARAANIPSRQTIYNIETGRQVTSVEQIEKLAAALGVAPEWLAFGKERSS